MAKKKPVRRPRKPAPKFPPRFSTKGVIIRGVQMLPDQDSSVNINVWPDEEGRRTKA